MNPTNDYTYDVFVSYSSHDREWAEHIVSKLSDRQYDVFLDRKDLKAGGKWIPQLAEAVQQSKHMIVLWSTASSQSQWVAHEIVTFQASSNGDEDRRLIFVLLNETVPAAYQDYHMLHQIVETQLYNTDGFSAISDSIWHNLLTQIERSIREDLQYISIPTIILSMTEHEFDRLKSDDKPTAFVDPFGELLSKLGIQDKSAIADNYGQHRSEWKAFATDVPLSDMLDGIIHGMNTRNQHLRIEWEEIEADFWHQDPTKVKEIVSRLMTGPVLIFIDPMSLYEESIYSRMIFINYLLKNPNAVIMTPSPIKAPPSHVEIRKILELMADQIFNRYYEQLDLNTIETAYCDLNINDVRDVQRSIQMALAPIFQSNQQKPVHNFFMM